MKNNDQLLIRAKEGDKEAKEEYVNYNLGLVHHIVKRFLGRGVEAEDLFQIGSIGLLKAIEHFDTKYGVQFSTYAVPMIQGEIKRFMRDDGMIKVSRSIKENSFKISKAINEYVQKFGQEPNVNMICEMTGLLQEDVVLAMDSMTEVESIYNISQQGDGKEQFLVDKLVGEKNEAEKIVNRVLLSQLLNNLGGMEKELLRLRYFEDKTQMQVAGLLGISQVQVSRLEKKIIMGLRKAADP